MGSCGSKPADGGPAAAKLAADELAAAKLADERDVARNAACQIATDVAKLAATLAKTCADDNARWRRFLTGKAQQTKSRGALRAQAVLNRLLKADAARGDAYSAAYSAAYAAAEAAYSAAVKAGEAADAAYSAAKAAATAVPSA